MHKGDSYEQSTDTYTIAGVKITRAVFEFWDERNVGKKFELVKREDNGTVTLKELP